MSDGLCALCLTYYEGDGWHEPHHPCKCGHESHTSFGAGFGVWLRWLPWRLYLYLLWRPLWYIEWMAARAERKSQEAM